MSKQKTSFKVGDLIRVVPSPDQNDFIFRPRGFPFGKIGLITEVSQRFRYPITDPDYYYSASPDPRSLYDYDLRWYYDDLYMILVEGKTYWVFIEEIEQCNHEGT